MSLSPEQNTSPSNQSQRYHPVSADDHGFSPGSNGVASTDSGLLFRSSYDDELDTGSHHSSLRAGGASSPGRSSAGASPLHLAGANSFDLDDDEEEEIGLRRYHLDFQKEMPLPAEFSHDSLVKRLWQGFVELRTKARQRRAARLLTMPSESFVYRLHACLLTWCCDATDRGILLVMACVIIWLLIGLVTGASARWWTVGVLLLVVRLSARRVVESIRARQQRQQRRRLSLENVELGTGEPWRDTPKD